jgi:hypothetical protein
VIELLARWTGVEVREAEEGFLQELASLPLAQRRCGSHKAFVRVSAAEIIKGPYSAHSLKLVNNLRYPYLVQRVEGALRLPEWQRGAYAWERLLCSENGTGQVYHLVARNLGCYEERQTERVSTLIDTDVEVIQRGTCIKRISEVEKVKQGSRFVPHPDFDEQTALASLQHLYFRYLLNIGDSGTHNILARPGALADGPRIAGIDFDEQRRGPGRRTALGQFFKADYTWLEAVYGKYSGRIALLEDPESVLSADFDESNRLTRAWAESLSARQAKVLGETSLFVGEVRERNEALRRLIA